MSANLIVGLDTSPALASLRRFKSVAEDEMRGFKVPVIVDLKDSVKGAIAELKALKGAEVDVAVKVDATVLKRAVQDVFDHLYEVKVDKASLIAQVQSAVNAGLAAAKFNVGTSAGAVREAGPGVDVKTVMTQVGAAVSDAVANQVGKAMQRAAAADKAGPKGSISYSSTDPETGKRVAYREPVDPTLALNQALAGIQLQKDLKGAIEASKYGPDRTKLLALRDVSLVQARRDQESSIKAGGREVSDLARRRAEEDAAWSAKKAAEQAVRDQVFDQLERADRRKLGADQTRALKEQIQERRQAELNGNRSATNYFASLKKVEDEILSAKKDVAASFKRGDVLARDRRTEASAAQSDQKQRVSGFDTIQKEEEKARKASVNSAFAAREAEQRFDADKMRDMERLAVVAAKTRQDEAQARGKAVADEIRQYQSAEDARLSIQKQAEAAEKEVNRRRQQINQQTDQNDVKNARFRNVAETDEAARLTRQIRAMDLAKDLIQKRNEAGRDGVGIATSRFGSELVETLPQLEEMRKRLTAIKDLNALAGIRTTTEKLAQARKEADDFKNVQFSNPGQLDPIKRLEGQLRTLAAATKLVDAGGERAGIKRFGSDAVAAIPQVDALRQRLSQLKAEAASVASQMDGWKFGPDFNTLTALRDSYNRAKSSEADRQVVNTVKYVNPGQENQVRALEAQIRKLAEAQEFVKQGRLDLAIERVGQAAVDDIPKLEALRAELARLRAEQAAASSGVSPEALLRRQMQATMAAAQSAASNSGQYTSFGARAAGAAAVREKFGDGPARAFLNNDELFNQSRNLDDHQKKVTSTTAAYRAWRESANDAHSAARGLAGSLGALWVTWGNTAPIVAAAAIGMAVRSVFTVGKDLEYQLAFVSALSENTAVSLNNFGAAVRGSMVAPVEAGQALRGLAQNGLSVREALEALPSILNLATVGEMSLSEAALGATGVMAAFNLQVSDLGRIGDVFAKAAAISNTSVQGMVEAMKQASTVSDQYKVSLEETAATLSVMAKRNIEGSAAGTAFRNMMVELTTPHEKAKRAMEAVGLQLYDNQNQLKDYSSVLEQLRDKVAVLNEKGRLTFLNEMFGERGAKAANALLSDFDLYRDNLSKLKNETEGFAASVNAALQETVQGKMRALVTEFQLATSETFSKANQDIGYFIDSLRVAAGSAEFQQMISNLVSGVTSLTNFVIENGRQIAITIGVWMTAKSIAGLAGGVMVFVDALKLATTASAALGVAMRGVIGAATGGLALVAALAVEYFLFSKNTDETVEAQKRLNNQLDLTAEALARERKGLEESNAVLARRVDLMRQGRSNKDIEQILGDDAEKKKGFDLNKATEQAEQNLGRAQGVIAAYEAWKKKSDAFFDRSAAGARLGSAEQAAKEPLTPPPVSKRDYEIAKQGMAGYIKAVQDAKAAESDFVSNRQLKYTKAEGEEVVRRRNAVNQLNADMKLATEKSKGRIVTVDLKLDPDSLERLDKDNFDKVLAAQTARFNERKDKLSLPDPRAAATARTGEKSEIRVLLSQLNREREDLTDKFDRQRKIDASLFDEKSLGAETIALIAQNRALRENVEMKQAQEIWIDKVQMALTNTKNLTEPDKQQLQNTLDELNRKAEKTRKDMETAAEVAKNNTVRKAREAAQEQMALMDRLRRKGDEVGRDVVVSYQKTYGSPDDIARMEAEHKVEETYAESVADARKRLQQTEESIAAIRARSANLTGQEAEENRSLLDAALEEEAVRSKNLRQLEAQRDLQKGKTGKEAVDAFRRSITAEAGFERFWNEYVRQGSDAATQVYDIMKSTTDNMGRAFEQFGATGKFSMRSLVNDIMSQLGRMAASAIWKQLLGVVMGSFGGENSFAGASEFSAAGAPGLGDVAPWAYDKGGVMTAYGNLPLRRYDAGGVARSPQLALYGEGKKPEAYVPLEDGRTIPVTVEGTSGGNNNMVFNFSPTINVDSRSDQAQVQAIVGRQIKSYHEQFTTQLKERGVMQ